MCAAITCGPNDDQARLTTTAVMGSSVAVVRVGVSCAAPQALETLRLCRAALVARDVVIVDLRRVTELSTTAGALLTRGARSLRGRMLLLASDRLREQLAVIGGCVDLVHWSELSEEEQLDLEDETAA